jgi:hypothetical protein
MYTININKHICLENLSNQKDQPFLNSFPHKQILK